MDSQRVFSNTIVQKPQSFSSQPSSRSNSHIHTCIYHTLSSKGGQKRVLVGFAINVSGIHMVLSLEVVAVQVLFAFEIVIAS